jgi:hypothetical protein
MKRKNEIKTQKTSVHKIYGKKEENQTAMFHHYELWIVIMKY